jgi:hypothetical protein
LGELAPPWLGIRRLVRTGRDLPGRPLIRLGLRLLGGFRRLVLLALAPLEVVVRFTWYARSSEYRPRS